MLKLLSEMQVSLRRSRTETLSVSLSLPFLFFKTRIAAAIIAFNMLLSVLLGHRDIMFSINDYGGWMIETNVLYMMTAVVLFFTGAGKYSLSGGKGKWD